MIIERNKLYKNLYFDLRSYEIETAKRKKEDICLIYQEQKMIIPLKEIDKRKLLLNKTAFKSKYNIGQTYLIYSFLFVPKTEEEEMREFSEQCLS